MKITFLLNNAYGIGGTIRSVANLSGGFAERGHQVRVTSLYRHRDTTSFAFDPRVPIETLIDQREGSADLALLEATAPSELLPEWHEGVSLLSDRRMAEHLAAVDADVVISTRPTLSQYLGHFGSTRYLRVGQEHSTLGTRKPAAQQLQLASVPLLDAFAPVSEQDAAAYREALPGIAERVVWIPNSSILPAVTPATGDSKVIVAAGRLVDQKRYDRLIDAFALLTDEFPDWQLRIYGRGQLRADLRAHIDRLHLGDRARLMGAVSPIETEWAKGSVAAVTSWWESFGLTIVEAMACGVPVVSTDCPTGPAEIITPGHDGLLIPEDGGPHAIAEGLRSLMKDDQLRLRMGAHALKTAQRYAPDVIAQRYEKLFATLRPQPKGLTARLRGLFTAGNRTATAPAGAPQTADPTPPAAHAVAHSDGSLTVHITPATHEDHLVLRMRGNRKRQIRLPLDRDGRATVARDAHDLAEGRWDAFLDSPDAPKPQRVTARLVETAALVTARPATRKNTVGAWIPYTTKDGNLTLRIWRRPTHAEVTAIETSATTSTITVTVHPAHTPLTGAKGHTEDGPSLDIPLAPAGDGTHTLTIDHTTADTPATWRLALTTLDGSSIPLTRIAGDTADRKKTDVYPTTDHGDLSVKLAFTTDNELTLTATRPA